MRIEQEEFQEWNMMIRFLCDVTCRFVTSNMRRIGLKKDGSNWIVEVIIEKDDSDDRAEARDFANELWYLSEDKADGEVHAAIIVDDGPSDNFPGFEGFSGPVYWRKED
jgi:hypothetical protein